MRSKALTDKLELRRLDAVCTRQAAVIDIMRMAIEDTVAAYKTGDLGHRQIAELASVLQDNAGHQMMALLSRLISLQKALERYFGDGNEGALRQAYNDAVVALNEGFYD